MNRLEQKTEEEYLDEQPRKPDIAANSAYSSLARALMSDLHGNQLALLEKGMADIEGPRTLVVVGPGSEVIPLSDNLEWVVKNLDGGNLVLLDYNAEICGKMPGYLASKGFDKLFSMETIEKPCNPSVGSDKLLVGVRDIRDGYPFPANSISGIDMTVAVHHATMYEADILQFCKEAYRALQPGGCIHIGEGNVDMKHNEQKMHMIADALIEFGAKAVVITDARYSSAEPRKLVDYAKDGHAKWPDLHTSDLVEMHISDRGMVELSGLETVGRFMGFLTERGYKQMISTDDSNLVLPYIDHAMEEDFQGLIVPVRQYYADIIDACFPELSEKYRGEVGAALMKEQSDAERGLVEFYSPPQMLEDNLKKAGFNIEETRYTSKGPFVNILAKKPR